MKNRFTIITILIASAAMLLSGCDPTSLDNDGKLVRFTARSKGFLSTKTSYSGQIYDNNKERIDWSDQDSIRIYSPKDEGNLWSPKMELVPVYEAENRHLDYVYSVYVLKKGETPNVTISPDPEQPWHSNANLYNNDDNGLTWTGDDAAFYGIYPVTDKDKDGENDRLIPHALELQGGEKHFLMEIKIPGAGTGTDTDTDVQTGDPDFVSTMPLMAKKTVVKNGNKVRLDFDPYFSAYEFNLKSKDETMTINSLTLSAQDGYIWGRFFWDITSDQPYAYNSTSVNPLNPDESKTITISGSWTISSTQEASITIFGLPNDLSNMTLTINFTTNNKTGEAVLPLALKDENDNLVPVTFGARKKTRINGLALGGGLWKLEIDGKVLPWIYYENTMDHQISLWDGVTIGGAIENTELWRSTVGYDEVKQRNSSNHYEGDGTYDQYYQIRTLNIHNSIATEDRYFTMSFMPTGPTGGYWELVPTFKDGDTESQNHFRFKLQDRQNGQWKEVGMDGLTGQVLSSRVTIKIYPDPDYDWSNTNLYYMWFKYYCRASRASAPISGDSEFQDVHGDGRFSYWTFLLGAPDSDDYDPNADPVPQN